MKCLGTWDQFKVSDSSIPAKTGNKVVVPLHTGKGDMIQSSWLRVSNNTQASTDADKAIAFSDAQHVFGRFGQGYDTGYGSNFSSDTATASAQRLAFSYQDPAPSSSANKHAVMISIFPDNIDSTGLTEVNTKQIHIKVQSVGWVNWAINSGAANVLSLNPGSPVNPQAAVAPDVAGAQALLLSIVSLALTMAIW